MDNYSKGYDKAVSDIVKDMKEIVWNQLCDSHSIISYWQWHSFAELLLDRSIEHSELGLNREGLKAEFMVKFPGW